jgi:hypothetical protein
MSSSNKFNCEVTLRQVFSRVCRLEKQSVMLVFSTQLVNCCPSNHLSGLTLPPPPNSLCELVQYAVYTYTVCKVGGMGFWASDR